MKTIPHDWPVYVGWSQKLNCRGVLALRDIKKGETIEECPILLIDYKNKAAHDERRPTKSLLDNYFYDWTEQQWCLPLGYAVLYNHSYQPNAVYVHDLKTPQLNYVALCDIPKDMEILINYNGEIDDQTPLETWFHEYSGRKFL